MPAITYTVIRTGDLTKASSVDWALSGELADADLATGQPKSGRLDWVANDITSRTVTINTKGNTADNPDRDCTVTLSNPVNATLGVATATTTVVDDDVAKLPAGYPTPPDMTGWTTVTVKTELELEAAIASATSAGKVIRLDAATNVFGSITINRPGAKIAIIAMAPRFSRTITERSALDAVDITPTTFDDPVVENKCIVGGRAAFKGHSSTNRVNINAIACHTLYVDGVDFWNGNNNSADLFHVTGAVTTGFACDQVWLLRCSFDRAVGFLCGVSGGGGTTNRYGVGIFVAWECYFFADGATLDTATSDHITDYGLRMYHVSQMYMYKCIIKGGFNHGISLKAGVGPLRIDDCVFAAFCSLNVPFNMLELGQEGSPSTTLDMTCGLTSVRGCTFTGIFNSPRRLVLCWYKEAVGVLFDNCRFYDRIPTFLLGGRFEINAGTKAAANNINSDFGAVLAGSGDVTVRNCSIKGAFGTVRLNRLFVTSGGTYTFVARNNAATGTRLIELQSSGVDKDVVAGSGFS